MNVECGVMSSLAGSGLLAEELDGEFRNPGVVSTIGSRHRVPHRYGRRGNQQVMRADADSLARQVGPEPCIHAGRSEIERDHGEQLDHLLHEGFAPEATSRGLSPVNTMQQFRNGDGARPKGSSGRCAAQVSSPKRPRSAVIRRLVSRITPMVTGGVGPVAWSAASSSLGGSASPRLREEEVVEARFPDGSGSSHEALPLPVR
jgi:hypothetical protein